MNLCFFHGLESSPQGTKARLIRKKYPGCLIPALPPDLDQRVLIAEQAVKKPVLIVGSSLGGLTALMYADRHPEMTAAMVLMAPAVGCTDSSLFSKKQGRILSSVHVPAGIPTVVVAGKRDELIPLAAIERMVERSPEPKDIRLHVVDDDHNLHQSLALMMAEIETLCRRFTRQPSD